MSIQRVLVKDAYGNVQTVDTSKTVTNVIGETTDAPITSPTADATLIAAIKGLLKDSQYIAKNNANYTISSFTVDATSGTKTSGGNSPAIGAVKGVLLEFSVDFDGDIADIVTKGSETLNRYFEAPAGGNLLDVPYVVRTGKMNVFKMTL